MSFLSKVAEWAEEHIPLIGEWISKLVEKIESAIEEAWGWIKDAINYIENTWIPYIEDLINSISLTIAQIYIELKNYIESAIDSLKSVVDTIRDWLNNVSQELKDLINNLPTIVYNLIPDWIKEGVKHALDEITKIWKAIQSVRDEIEKSISDVTSWVSKELDQLKCSIISYIGNIIEPIQAWIDNFKSRFHDFLKDPISYIKNIVNPIINKVSQELSEFSEWVQEKVHGFTDAISSIDDYLLTKLEGFILGLIAWFIASFIWDLATLEYDPETHQVYGKPRNPLTHILIWLFEVEKPENPYQSVKSRMGIKEVKGHG